MNSVKIYFLIFDKVEELDLVGSWEFVGLLAEKNHCEPPKLISLNKMNPMGEHGMRFSADFHFSDSEFPDVLIIPGGSGSRKAAKDIAVSEFLRQAEEKCSAILSICTGIYLLQAAGLLKGKRATTHWAFLKDIKADPEVEVIEERYVKDGKIWSSGGVSAGMDMTLAFIADFLGENIASEIQLDAEYFPASTVYGSSFKDKALPKYLHKLCDK